MNTSGSPEAQIQTINMQPELVTHPSVYKRLGELALSQSIEVTESQQLALTTAEKYHEFGAIKDTAAAMESVLERSATTNPAFANEVRGMLNNLVNASDILKLSLQKQAEYGLVDKRWIRQEKYMENALAAGRRALELDVRIDKEGGFWVSHATGARSSYASPHIHEMTTKEMQEHSRRFSLDEAFKVFADYKDDHKLILELKTLGPDVHKFPEVVSHLKDLIEQYKAGDSVAVSSLSPGILMEVHKVLPEIPLILNGGIVPGITFEKPNEKSLIGNLTDKFVPTDKKWRAFDMKVPGLGSLFEVVVAAGEDTVIRPDGEGTQTGYLLTRLPEDLTNVLKEQKDKEFGGMVSLSAVTMLASALEYVPGGHKKAETLRKYYKDVVDELGLKTMATTWGQNLSKYGLHALSAPEQIKVFKKLGIDLVYTAAPEEFAHMLPDLRKLRES